MACEVWARLRTVSIDELLERSVNDIQIWRNALDSARPASFKSRRGNDAADRATTAATFDPPFSDGDSMAESELGAALGTARI
jgi:hypothetical protein